MKSDHQLFSSYFLVTLLFMTSCISEQVSPGIDCPTIEVLIDQVENTDCGETQGSFFVQAIGGNPPYSFEVGSETKLTGSFNSLAAGVYNVIVTDQDGCKGGGSVSILNINGVGIDGITVGEAGCGVNQGSVEVAAVGGVVPYTFELSGLPEQTEPIFSGLAVGDYSLSVTDAEGCEVTQQVTITSGISYQNTIQSIIQTNCAISGCHNGTIAPDLLTFDDIKTSASRIKARTANRSMPRGRSLTQEQIDEIACWVDDGALEN